jgi:hypothetical protein
MKQQHNHKVTEYYFPHHIEKVDQHSWRIKWYGKFFQTLNLTFVLKDCFMGPAYCSENQNLLKVVEW